MNIALLVGINSYPDNPLRGCLHDVESMTWKLMQLGFSVMHIRRITENRAIKDVILDNLNDMVTRAQEGDHLVFHYSGHGSQLPDGNNDEPDGLDECLCPYDWPNAITDDELRSIILRLNGNATLDVILDCCHSGTGLREPDNIVARFIPYPDYMWPKVAYLNTEPSPLLRGLDQPNVALWAGCKSNQTSADAYIDGKYQGAMTWALCQSLSDGLWKHMNKDNCNNRYHVINRIEGFLRADGYDQEPQLETSDEMKNREIFT